MFSSTVEGDGRHMFKREFIFGWKSKAAIEDGYVHMFMGNLEKVPKGIYKERRTV